MTRFHSARFALVIFLFLGSASCTAPIQSRGALEAGWHAMQPIPASVVLLVPDDFERYVYVFSHRGSEIPIPLGLQAADQMEALLRSAFTSTSVMTVESEAAARDMIARVDPQLDPYDLVAVPRIMNVSSYDKTFEYGFNVDVALEITDLDKGSVEKIGGHGEVNTPVQSGSSPDQSARTALSYAMDAVKDGLEARRASLKQ